MHAAQTSDPIEPPLSAREKLLWFSRSYTFTTTIYLAPVTFVVFTVFLIAALSVGLQNMLSATDSSGAQILWLIVLIWSWVISWVHHNWRTDMLDGGSLPPGSVRLWLGSVLLKLFIIGLYLWQMTDVRPDGWRLKHWELHLMVCALPCYALLVAVFGLRICIRLRAKLLHNRRRLLS